MKAYSLIGLLAVVCLIGCGDNNPAKPAPPTNAPAKSDSGNPLTAPVDYLGALGKAKQSAEKTIDTVSVNQAITYFSEAEGRYPTDLAELVAKHYLHEIPKPPYGMKFVYDAATGTVKVVKP